MTLTRRELAGVVAAGTTAARTPQAPDTDPESPAQLARSAQEDLDKTTTAIRKVKVPIDTEPAFAFRAQ